MRLTSPRALLPYLFLPLWCGLALLTTRPAHAFSGEAMAWFGPSVANLTASDTGLRWGPGGQLGLQLGLNDFWKLAVGLEGSYHFATTDDDVEVPATPVTGAFVGARYALDVFTYVPYAGLALTGFLDPPSASATPDGPALGAKLTLGVDWRTSRYWSWGVLVEVHMSFSEPGEIPVYSTANVHLGYHFRLF